MPHGDTLTVFLFLAGCGVSAWLAAATVSNNELRLGLLLIGLGFFLGAGYFNFQSPLPVFASGIVAVCVIAVGGPLLLWRWWNEMIPIDQASIWLYANGGESLRNACRTFASQLGGVLGYCQI